MVRYQTITVCLAWCRSEVGTSRLLVGGYLFQQVESYILQSNLERGIILHRLGKKRDHF